MLREQFGKDTWKAIRWTLENSGPLTVRDMVFRFYKTPHGYFDIAANEKGAQKARELLARHPDEFQVEPFPDYFRKFNVNYYFPLKIWNRDKKYDIPASPINLPHHSLIQAVFFALDKAYGDQLTDWTTDPSRTRFAIQTKDDGNVPDNADACAVINGRPIAIEVELTQKEQERLKLKFRRYDNAIRRGPFTPNTYVLYVCRNAGLKQTLLDLAKKLNMPSNLKFCTLQDMLTDPTGPIYVFNEN